MLTCKKRKIQCTKQPTTIDSGIQSKRTMLNFSIVIHRLQWQPQIYEMTEEKRQAVVKNMPNRTIQMVVPNVSNERKTKIITENCIILKLMRYT